MNPSEEPQTATPEVPEPTEPADAADSELAVPETDDPAVDVAVEDIIRKEGDEVLKAQDRETAHAVVMKIGAGERFKDFLAGWWGDPRKKWGTITVIVVVIAAVFAVPLPRYELLGLFIREKITVVVSDSKTGAPVSNAQVVVGAEKAESNADGKAVLYVHAGSRYLTATKSYYRGAKQTILVTLSPGSNVFIAQLDAQGRQVRVAVNNKLTGKPVAGATVSAGGVIAKTNATGTADLVLPSGAASQSATIALAGYNNAQVSMTAAGTLTQNTFTLTPSGEVYFLSNESGPIDVVKTNLDGSNRQTVLGGTGDEDPSNTRLFTSSDWKYIALLSKRSGSTAALYLIDTTNGDKLTTIDGSDASFTPIGWSGDKFIYEMDRSSTVNEWQAGQEALKSFDPATGQTLLLDQSQGSGKDQADWMQQNINAAYLIGGQIVYLKGWNGSPTYSTQVSQQQAELDTINPDGSNHRVVKTFTYASGITAQSIGISAEMAEPNELYIRFDDGDQANFFVFQNGSVTADTSLTDSMFQQTPYPTYFVSPSGNSTLWETTQNGLDTLYIGDQNANNQKQLSGLSQFNPYGWYTDGYLLVSENGDALYVVPSTGGTPFKIADYYKPPSTFKG